MMMFLEATGLARRSWRVVILITINLLCFSAGTPIDKHRKVDVGKCLNISRHLLKEVKHSLTHPDVTEGFNCSNTEIILEDITANQTHTVWACSPEQQEPSRCKDGASPHNCLRSSQCYQNITADLHIYQAKLRNFIHVTNNVCKDIASLLKALNSDSSYEDVDLEGVSTNEGEKDVIDFPQRMALCKVLQAFKLRTITINRVMNYLSKTED